MRDSFTYAPGDGHRYTWSRGHAWITVERIIRVGDGIGFEPTGDQIPAPHGTTGQALMATVDTWRLHYEP